MKRFRLFSLVVVLALAARSLAADAGFAQLMNAGKAHLENRNSAKAIEAFAAAVKLEPRSAPALRNLARAQLLANQNDDALQQLAAARAVEKESAANSYLTGLAHVHAGQYEQAVPHLEEAVRLDAFMPTLRFQLANAAQLARQEEKALAQLRETVRLDPLHGSAHFKLATFAMRAGDQATAAKHQQEFQRLRKMFNDDTRTPAALERCVYALPEPAPTPPTKAPAGINVKLLDATKEALPDDRSTAAAVVDVETNGICTIAVANAGGAVTLLAWGKEKKFVRTPTGLLLPGAPFAQCVTGNYFDDVPKGEKYDAAVHAKNDVLFVGSNGVRLLKRTGPATFEDATTAAGLGEAKAHRAQWLDFDHDGDVDLLVAATAGLQLWQNNGNGTFSNVTSQAGIGVVAGPVDVAPVDLDANVAMDFVAARGAEPTLVFMNQRAGSYAKLSEPPGPWPAARRVLADDLDNDGNPDTVLVAEKEALVLFGKRADRQRLVLSGLDQPVAALVDFDNDGLLDVCAAGANGKAQLWRNDGTSFSDVSDAVGLATATFPAVREIVAVDFDADGDTDLLLVTDEGLRVLRNDGGNANSQLKLRLVGLKTNPLGLGTRVEARAAEFVVTRMVTRLPIEIGVGNRAQLDSLQTIWGNGVFDNQLDVAVKASPLTVPEKNVAAGSCPYLYAWDGKQFRFVTDLLGNSPLGLSLRRGVMLGADPNEIVLIGDAKNFQPRDGAYELQVTEELREVLYLDEAHLIAVDHAPDVEVHSTDRLGPPPYGPSELWELRAVRTPIKATGDDGVDRTDYLRAIDGVFAEPGIALPPPLRGQCEPLAVTLDFGPLDTARPLVLALTGWIQYGDASANIAASQNAGLPVIPPTLEVEADGRWQRVDVVVGMPAGKTKTIVCDLAGKLPKGATRLRLTTTFELRWDRIVLFERGGGLKERSIRPSSAQLAFRGFSEIKSRAPGHPQTPEHAKVSARPPWKLTPQGWCTRYGDVLPLVRSRDEKLVLVNAGDAVTLRFDAKGLPPVPAGMTRTFFFHSVGWDKDGDHNVVEGDAVEPLPVSAKGGWQTEFNTRWVRADEFDRR